METAILPFDDIQLLAESGEIDSIQLLQQLQDRITADRVCHVTYLPPCFIFCFYMIYIHVYFTYILASQTIKSVS